MARPRKQTDEQLVSAAARAIAARGPHELTLAHVAEEAGVAPATLVQRFGSKRDLLLAVAAGAPSTVAGAFAAARAAAAGPLDALEAALVSLAATVSDPDEVANHLAFLALDLADPEFRAHAAGHTAAMAEQVGALLKEASQAGELELRGRRAVAELVQAAYHGTLLMWAIDRQGRPEDRVRDRVRLILRPYRRRAAQPCRRVSV